MVCVFGLMIGLLDVHDHEVLRDGHSTSEVSRISESAVSRNESVQNVFPRVVLEDPGGAKRANGRACQVPALYKR